ncbi:hypothetical protein FOL47_000143 [Perkinsus chesapeaki]|uniref:Peptidyl-prolyl cis-trans isomerase n=1 Tax=Perkinsus chesapeaki TaxID=330153 RepID=A0A7J6N408_PERCH|nr:hypothetical protein FOL47_000143 [Perkinsus chesapeaki]
MSVLLDTSVGEIVVDLEVKKAPKTCENFVLKGRQSGLIKLCKLKAYNNALIHTIQADFICEIGGPEDNTSAAYRLAKMAGEEEPSPFITDEIRPDLKHDRLGTVAMASTEPGENGMQFYITLRDEVSYLDGKHTIFGYVPAGDGDDVLRKMNEVFVDEENHPYNPIRIKHTAVLDDPFPDPADWPAEEPPSPDEIIDEKLQTNLDDQEEEEIEERRATAQAQAQSIGLELMGDLPDAESKASDKELFVCQLNEVTEDDDLRTIFERFGPIKSCDVVRDFKTGESLQYAFIEFETKEACEMAYVKMQNVVIDDKRIKVDFSQSVSKQWREIRQKQREELRKAARGERPPRRPDDGRRPPNDRERDDGRRYRDSRRRRDDRRSSRSRERRDHRDSPRYHHRERSSSDRRREDDRERDHGRVGHHYRRDDERARPRERETRYH